jgi:hypothetical protein
MSELYKSTWLLTGTDAQNAIIRRALDRIKFPWDRIVALDKPIPIGWMNLNTSERVALLERYLDASGLQVRYSGDEHDHPDKIPGHVHVEDEDGNEGHGILRKIGDRWMIAGVFWTDGRIYIDISLESRPEVAQEVVSAEVAHAVDYGLPLSDDKKNRISAIFHPSSTDTHTWWERQDYGSEYYTLVGEAFMALFTHAYSDMQPWQDPFTHKSTKELGVKLQQILGIPQVGSNPAVKVISLKGYRTFHKPSHYLSRWEANPVTKPRIVWWASAEAARAAGLVACKVCKAV